MCIVLKNQRRLCKQLTSVLQACINISKGKKIFDSHTCIKKIHTVYFILKPVGKNIFFKFWFSFQTLIYWYMACTLAFIKFSNEKSNCKQGNPTLWLYLRVDHRHVVFR